MLAKLPIVEAATGDAPSNKIAALRSPNKLLPIAGPISVDAAKLPWSSSARRFWDSA